MVQVGTQYDQWNSPQEVAVGSHVTRIAQRHVGSQSGSHVRRLRSINIVYSFDNAEKIFAGVNP